MPINIVVPEVGESIVDARVARWLKKEGDAVSAGEPLVELETDKVDVEVAAPKNGVLQTIAHRDGADVKIGDVLGTIEPGAPAASGTPAASGAPGTDGTARPSGAAAATPSARKLAREQDVRLDAVKPEGPRVTKSDVERSMAKTAPTAKPDAPPKPGRIEPAG